MPSVVELFAGGGGAALGLHAAGFYHLACLELNVDACETLRQAGFPVVEGDASDLELFDPTWEGTDLLWASFPCQAWSQAGKREGASGLNLWPATLKWIDRVYPRHFIAENVAGLTMHKGACKKGCLGSPECPRAYFDIEIMAELAARFPFVGARIIDCADLGLPQHRRRVIIQAAHSPLAWPEPTHGSPRNAAQGDLFGRVLLPWNTVGDALGLGQGSALQIDGGRNSAENPTQERPAGLEEPCPTVSGRGNTVLRVVGGGRNPQNAQVSELRSFRDLTDEPSTTIAASQIGNAGPWVIEGGKECSSLSSPGVPAGAALRPRFGGGSSGGTVGMPLTLSTIPLVSGDASNRSRSRGARSLHRAGHPELLDRPSAAVTATEYKGTNGKESTGWTASGGPARASDTLWLATGRRRLTPEECAALQGFPPTHRFFGSLSSQYRQIGNAVPPVLAESLGRLFR